MHGVAVASARAGNVIGGGDWARDRLVPDIIRALSTRTPIVIRNPESIRPWQHVLEPLGAYLRLAERLATEGPKYAGGWNFGPDDPDTQPVRWIVERFISQWGDGANWKEDDSQQPHEAGILKLDCSKARRLLDWKPRWQLSQAVDNIVEWHKSFLHNADMRALTHSQIETYRNS
jgi:CDP-glucose 4,6-dehydratase